jgi:GxxExxY protein
MESWNMQMGTDFEKRDEQTYTIIGAAMAVHRELGHGFLEAVYQAALERELMLQRIPFEREVRLPVSYRGDCIAEYQADFICYGEVIVELKAMQKLTGVEEAQVINYLKATRYTRGLLINFGAPSLQHERLVFNLR